MLRGGIAFVDYMAQNGQAPATPALTCKRDFTGSEPRDARICGVQIPKTARFMNAGIQLGVNTKSNCEVMPQVGKIR